MMRRIAAGLPRAIAAGILGAVAGAAWLVFFYAARPALVFEFDRDAPPKVLAGFYAAERAPDGLTFAWTRDRAEVRLPGLDRSTPWRIRVNYRAARPDPGSLPEITLDVDLVPVLARQASNDFDELVAEVPVRPGTRGLVFSIHVSTTFTPSEQDPRALGVVVDRITIEPRATAAVAPRPWLRTTLAVGALFGFGFGLMGLTAGSAVGAVSALTAGVAAVVSRGFAPYLDMPWLAALAAVIALAMVIGTLAAEGGSRPSLRNTARFAIAFSASALFLKLLVLLHPGMRVGDAMFHAHRFEWVLSGRYYFTSVAPGGYQFPYGISLYLTAVPFAGLFGDVNGFMQLLRTIVAVADTLAGLMLYPLVVRITGDRVSGAIAVALFHLIPLDFQVQTVGNLTNAFGQSLFVIALALVAMGWLVPAAWGRMLCMIALVSWAMIAHLSTFVILVALLPLVALALMLMGNVGRKLAAPIIVVALIAFGLALLAYYGHFADTYRVLFARIFGEVARPIAETDPGGRTLVQRLAYVPYAFGIFFGWPNLVLGSLGAAWLWRHGRGGVAEITLGAWSLTCGAFLVIGVLTPVDMRYYLAWFPALAILAATGAGWLWRQGLVARAAGVALMAWSAGLGIAEWLRPLR